MTSAATPDPQQLAAYFALMDVSRLLQHAVEQHLRVDGGISYVQFEILTRLFASPTGEQRMTDLADGIVYSRSALTYQVDQLEQSGLISRAPSAQDERSINVSITAAGRALVQALLPGHIRLVRQMLLDHLNRRDLGTLTRVLGRVRDRLRQAPPRSAAPRRRRDKPAG
jgi:DNA-binding MarR family transcriptional regulator